MKWKIPETIYILGVLHTIEIREFTDADDDPAAAGLYASDGRAIHIDATQPKYLRHDIFCHEIAEGINSVLDLGLNHCQITSMGAGFHDVFRNQL